MIGKYDARIAPPVYVHGSVANPPKPVPTGEMLVIYVQKNILDDKVLRELEPGTKIKVTLEKMKCD